jgi:leucyl aminopeptidase (aminopeptidase T)
MVRESFWDQQVDSAVKVGRLNGIVETTNVIASKCLDVSPDKSYLVIHDPETSPMIVESLVGSIQSEGGEVVTISFKQLPHPSAEPPDLAASVMKDSDVFINMCTKTLSHSHARHVAQYESGSNYYIMPAQTEDSFLRGAATADPEWTRERTENLQGYLADSSQVRVTSELGTDISFSIEDRPPKPIHAFLKDSDEGVVRSWPSGETPTFPRHDDMSGEIVIDSFMMGVGLLDDDIRWDVEEGVVTSISGGPDSKILTDKLADLTDEDIPIGEFSIGTNPQARIVGKPFEDKQVAGSVHFAIGTGVYNPPHYEPEYDRDYHLDGVISKPTVEVDGETIVVDGELSSRFDPA